MQITRFDEPWSHVEYSNFFSNFEEIKEYAYKILDTKKESSLHIVTNSNNSVYRSLKPLLVQHFKKISKILGLPAKESYIPVLSFASLNGGKINGIHVDASWKILSMLVYLSETGNGTRLYKVYEKDIQKIIEWRENGGVAFVNGENHWHEVGLNTNKGPRVIANIMFGEIEKIQEFYPDWKFDDK